MITLATLENSSRPKKKVQRLGRGTGSKRGKTCCRGGKGDSARSGYKKRFGHEGGQKPLYRRMPTRGFTRGLFLNRLDVINFETIEEHFQNGEVVSQATLFERGLVGKQSAGVKLLGNGQLTKKVSFEINALSGSAKEKLEQAGIAYTLV